MRNPRTASSHRGVTLIEAMTTLTVLGILSVGVSGLYIQAIKMYKRGQRESTARDKAALALERMMPEIREAYNVDYPGPGMIVFTLPEKDTNGRYKIDPTTKALIPGPQVVIYESGPNGTYDPDGHYIWRKWRPDDMSGWNAGKSLMDSVEDLSFTYAPSVELLELVRATVTVGQGTYPGYYNRTEIAEVWIRNH
jgi:prepilin-type N-terminal cleavage/methylation domain-containing protein